MDVLSASLQTIGLSQAKGIELAAQREQLDATLPRAAQADAAPAREEVRKPGPTELTPEQQRQVAQLQQVDREVRAHEQAHLQAGRGVVTSGASFTYTYGPDGKQYAVGGEVGIDTRPERKPEANIDKGIRIQAAALAPKEPSPQDYRVASIGGQLEAQGRSDLARQQAEEARTGEAALRRTYSSGAGEDVAKPGATVSVFA